MADMVDLLPKSLLYELQKDISNAIRKGTSKKPKRETKIY
jgi:hypothetical protein